MKCALLSRLLSGRNAPSVLEKEALLTELLSELDPPRRQRRWGLGRAGVLAPAFGALTALLLFVLPSLSGSLRMDELVPRGLRQASVEVRCLDPLSDTATDCTPGSVLALAPAPPVDLPYFAAFALREDGALLWYFPEDEGSVSELLADYGGPVDRGIALDAEEHPPGSYELVAVFSEEPLDREELRQALGPELAVGAGLDLVRRPFEVVPQTEDR